MFTNKQYNRLISNTPVFICDSNVVLYKLSVIENFLNIHYPNYKIAYSFKTNYSFALSKKIKDTKLLAEVVSQKEYLLAKKNNFSDNQIIFNGPNKDLSKISDLIKKGVTVNIDNFSELNWLIKQNISGEIGLRVNIKIKKMKLSRFGFSLEDNFKKALQLIIDSKLKLSALHCHIGTNINGPYAYKVVAKKMAELVNELYITKGIVIKTIDLGGGFPSDALLPIEYEELPTSIKEYLSVITNELNKTLNVKDKPSLILEPGRYLVDDSVKFFTKVIDSRLLDEKQVLTVDATMNMIPTVWYKPQKIKVLSQKNDIKNVFKTTIFGSSCQENDILFKEEFLECKKDDILIFYSMGAYNSSQASNFIFDAPKEIVI